MIEWGPLAKSHCPQCGNTLDGATIIHGVEGKPEEGDFSVCLNCGQLLIYQADLTVRQMTAAELREAMKAAESWTMIEKAQRFIQLRGRFL